MDINKNTCSGESYSGLKNINKDRSQVIRDEMSTIDIVRTKISLDNHAVLAILDTGSNVSFISKDIANKLGKTIQNQPYQVQGYGGSFVNALGKVWVKIQMNDQQSFEFKITVMENDQIPILLGNDFLVGACLVLDLNQKEIIDTSGNRTPLLINDQYEHPWVMSTCRCDEELIDRIELASKIKDLQDDESESKIREGISEEEMAELGLAMLPHPADITGANMENANIGDQLSSNERQDLKKLLTEYQSVFTEDSISIPPPIKNVIIDIDTTGIIPVAQKPRRVSPQLQGKLKELLDKYQKAGLIVPAISPWASPIILVPKKDGNLRLCVDLREVNKKFQKLNQAYPNIADTLEKFQGLKCYVSADAASGFNQLALTKQARDVLTFTCPFGNFSLTRLAQGFINSPAIFQGVMNQKITGKDKPYIDDFSLGGRDYYDLRPKLISLLEDCKKARITLSLAKSYFGTKEITFLGHRISNEGKSPKWKDISKIIDFPVPRSVKGIESFLGCLNFYRKYIPNFAGLAACLYEVKDEDFTPELPEIPTKAFNELKRRMLQPHMQKFIDENKQYHVIVYANDWSISSGLAQMNEENQLYDVGFASRILSRAEIKLTRQEKEVLSLLNTIKEFEPYLTTSTKPIKVYTRYSSLKWILTTQNTYGRVRNWSIMLSTFNLDIIKVDGKKFVIPALLAGALLTPEQAEVSLCEFQPKKVGEAMNQAMPNALWNIDLGKMGYLICFDGAYSCMNKSGTHGCVIWKLPELQFIGGIAARNNANTVNEAEYMGLIEALNYIQSHLNPKALAYVLGDSQLVIRQIQNEINTNSKSLVGLKQQAENMEGFKRIIDFYHVPHIYNSSADNMTRLIMEATEDRKIFGQQDNHICLRNPELLWDKIHQERENHRLSMQDPDSNTNNSFCLVITR